MSRKLPRIFIGLHEIGHLTLFLARGLRELGYSVTNVVMEIQSPLDQREFDHDRYILRHENRLLQYFIKWSEFIRLIPSHRIFVFTASESFFSPLRKKLPKPFRKLAYFDLILLRLLGKKIVLIPGGSEIRCNKLLIQEMEEARLDDHTKYASSDLLDEQFLCDDEKRQHVALMEQFADVIVTRPIHAQLLTKPFHLLWLPIDIKTVNFSVPTSQPPLVVHAPSSTRIKGTRYVLDAVERLRKEGFDFRFQLCQNMSNIEVRQILSEASIAIDQLLLPGYAFFAIEAMASGNAVLGSAVPGYNGFPDLLPIISTTPGTIYENLKRLLTDVELRYQLANSGQRYVEKYHDYKEVVASFARLINE